MEKQMKIPPFGVAALIEKDNGFIGTGAVIGGGSGGYEPWAISPGGEAVTFGIKGG